MPITAYFVKLLQVQSEVLESTASLLPSSLMLFR